MVNKYITIATILLPLWLLVSCDNSEKEFESAKKTNTIEAYENFIQQYSQCDLAPEAEDSLISLYSRRDLKDIPINHQNQEIANRLKSIVEPRVDSLYRKAMLENDISAWQTYIETVPQSYIYDANYRIKDLEEKAEWSTETKAWETAYSRGTTASMQKYLSLYPKGPHAKQAEKNIIDLEVAAVFDGEHGELPQMTKGAKTGSDYSVIEIENRTEYDLSISYSGPDTKRLVIPPHDTKSMRIGNGKYRVAATVGHGVQPFTSQETLDSRRYRSSFYIYTTRRY